MANLFSRKLKSEPLNALKRIRREEDEPSAAVLDAPGSPSWLEPQGSDQSPQPLGSDWDLEREQAAGPREVTEQDKARSGDQEPPFSYLERALKWEEELGLQGDTATGVGQQTEPPENQGAYLYEDEDEDLDDLTDSLQMEMVSVAKLHPNTRQPRRAFHSETLKGLAESLLQNGMLQPILVRHHSYKVGEFEIVAGERRWRAAEMAGLSEVPVLVRELADNATIEVSIIENLQREDLTPLELAEGYQQLIQDFHHNQEGLARTLGKSRSHVTNTLRLLSLPPEVKAMIQDGELSAGHARALVGCDGALSIAQEIVRKGLSVRDTEELVKSQGTVSGSKAKSGNRRGGEALEPVLTELLGQKVTVSQKGNKGKLTIHFSNQDELSKIVNLLKGGSSMKQEPEVSAPARSIVTDEHTPVTPVSAISSEDQTRPSSPYGRYAQEADAGAPKAISPPDAAHETPTSAPSRDAKEENLKALAEKYGLPWPLTRNENAYGPRRDFDEG
ncbi:MAG: ParB/RepB/Spo0J family partition protein [Pseudomonadota bacterium]